MRGYLTLVSRIEEDIIEIERLIDRIKKGWEYSKSREDYLYLDSVALNLHSFYQNNLKKTPSKTYL